jgi:hypothetical protein
MPRQDRRAEPPNCGPLRPASQRADRCATDQRPRSQVEPAAQPFARVTAAGEGLTDAAPELTEGAHPTPRVRNRGLGDQPLRAC